MMALWKTHAARFDAMSNRERAMIAAAVLGGILFIGFSFFIEPALKGTAVAERAAAELRAQLAGARAQAAGLQVRAGDPERAAQAELAELKRRIGETSARFSLMEGKLVPPQRVAGLLEDLIGHSAHSARVVPSGQGAGLRLLGLRTLPVSPVLEPRGEPAGAPKGAAQAAPRPAEAGAGLYKHGVEIRLEGSYAELTAYLARLEKSPLKLLWSELALDAENHPRLVLTLTVYTLSLDRTWLIV